MRADYGNYNIATLHKTEQYEEEKEEKVKKEEIEVKKKKGEENRKSNYSLYKVILFAK